MNAFSPSASMTSGIVARSTSAVMNRWVAGPWPRPGPIARTSRAMSSTRSTPSGSRPSASSAASSSASVMYSGPIAATTAWQLDGVATVTRPAPERSAPTAARCAAPVLPREPATISTRPKSPLWLSGARGVTISRMALRVSSSTRGPSRLSSTSAGMPMSAMTMSPARVSPGGSTSGSLGAPSVTVVSASIDSPIGSASSAERPDGRSIETTGDSGRVDVGDRPIR